MKIIKQNFRETAKAIKSGKVLVCPTDTVYGLVCDANNKKAVERLYKIKKRPKGKPLPIFVKDIRMAKKLAKISPDQEEELKRVWPGKVTAVLGRKDGKGTIGLRIPNYPWLLGLVKKLNKPLTGTSANISGDKASTKIKEILRQFEEQKHQPDLVVDAGNLPKSKPSKVIDLTVWPYKILRT